MTPRRARTLGEVPLDAPPSDASSAPASSSHHGVPEASCPFPAPLPRAVPAGCVLVSVPRGDMRNEGSARRFATAATYAAMLEDMGVATVMHGETCMIVCAPTHMEGDPVLFERTAGSRVDTSKATDVEEAGRRGRMLADAARATEPDAAGWRVLTAALDRMRLKYDEWS